MAACSELGGSGRVRRDDRRLLGPRPVVALVERDHLALSELQELDDLRELPDRWVVWSSIGGVFERDGPTALGDGGQDGQSR